MKVLYVDPISPRGHKNFNYGVLRSLSKIDNIKIDILVRKEYLELEDKNIIVNKVDYIDEKYIPEYVLSKAKSLNQYRVQMRTMQFIFLKKLFKSVKEKDYDLILFSCIDLMSFSLSSFRVKNRCVFIDHSISDLAESNFKKFFWKKINKNFEAVIMEEYIENFVKNVIEAKNKIWLVHHALPKLNIQLEESNIANNEKPIIFAPADSNDEEFIQKLIENSRNLAGFYKIMIKSKKYVFQSENLEVYNRRLTDEEYIDLMNSSVYILLPYQDNYNYKTSGVFYEAVYFKKPVLLRANNTLVYYKEKYPDIVKSFHDINDMISILQDEKLPDNNSKDFEKVQYDYSDEKISDQLKKMIWNN